jgi:hypothetical protein
VKAALSIVLAGLLATLPIKQVLAQAAQQDATSATNASIRAERVIGVPKVTAATAALWQPMLIDRLPSDVRRNLLDIRQGGGGGMSTGVTVLLTVLVAAAAIALAVFVIKNADESCGTEVSGDIYTGFEVTEDTCETT